MKTKEQTEIERRFITHLWNMAEFMENNSATIQKDLLTDDEFTKLYDVVSYLKDITFHRTN